MSISDTLKAQKYASIAEIAAAQSKLYADKLESAPDYAAQAAASASLAATSATQAESAALTSVSAANSATASALSAANSAEAAGEAAADAIQNYVDQSVRVSGSEAVNPVPLAATRANSVFLWDGASQPSSKLLSEFATLDGTGKIPVSMIPAIALTEPFVVSSQAAMLALNAQVGDIAKRTDLGYSFCLASAPPSTLSNWVQLTDDVLAQLGLSSGATMVGAVDDSSNPTTVQGALNLKTSIASLAASTGATLIGATNNAGTTSTVQSVLNLKIEKTELAANDGERFIGECPTVAALRALEPSYDKQRITLREYTAGSGKGGGQLRAVLSGSSYTDNGVTIFKTPGGAAWVRVNADIINPLMAGAVGTGLTTDDDTVAIQRIQILSGATVDFLGLTYYTTADLDFSGAAKSVFRNGTLKPSSATLNVARVSNAGHIIDGLNIDGTLATGAIGYSVTITATGAQIRNLRISNTGRSAIACSASESLIYRVTTDSCGLLAVSPFVNTFYIIANEGTIVEECRMLRCYNGVYFRTDLTASKTSRNKLINTLMVGDGQTADAGAQGVSSQNNFGLEVTGCYISGFPDNGIDLQQSDYCDISKNHVINCKDGVFIGDRSCKGHKIFDNHFDSCVRGFRFYCVSPELSASFYDIQFTNNTIVSPKTVGIYVWLPNAVDSGQCIISMNTIRMTGSISGASHAIQINNLFNSSVDENKIVGCPQNGIVFTGASTIINARGNSINNSSRGNTNIYDAVYVDTTTSRIFIRDTVSVGGGKAAVNIAGGAGHTVAGTRWGSMGTGGIINNGSSTTLLDNVAI
ncbi:right-handed parallel beta-helix repeat-containing protein [Enterobacter soli]|uniref:right-handed parallel beta-helix repeat-containing protein n=1 Tax=Enterobacter soli TaxID=885040 RepID=UPI002899CC31|nr:right-handed parallel beta-helix repeat-containing protein [Enterobacter soli]